MSQPPLPQPPPGVSVDVSNHPILRKSRLANEQKPTVLLDRNRKEIFSIVNQVGKTVVVIPDNGPALILTVRGIVLNRLPDGTSTVDLCGAVEGYASVDGIVNDPPVASAPPPRKIRVIEDL